ncbi:MAG: hypothetical protein IPJ78_18210 [Gemmatimonadetes bacterium]|nr:hypothetical protein [Gemmatimonadota bacterium]
MTLLSVRDRRIEMAILAVWALLLAWALGARFFSAAPAATSSGSITMLTGMVLGSASQFVTQRALRWTLLTGALIAVAAGLWITLA